VLTVSKLSGIYGVLPSGLESDDLLNRAEAALKGGVRILQFRDKKQGYKRALQRAMALRQLTLEYEATFIVNDSIQLALDCSADGVHLGRNDETLTTAKLSEIGEKLMVGITCRADAALAKSVLDSGVDYVAFGAVWKTVTKPEVPEIGLQRLAKARQIFPDATICAIGGISAANIAAVKATGADCAALISGLFAAQDIELQARKLVEIWSLA
jgi:thiamine-phosphate pyrophosphorylase